MFFVILGVVILVISFVVALVSLLREQSKLDSETEDIRATSVQAEKDLSKQPKPSLSEATNGILSDFEGVESKDFKAPADVDRQLFPWEEAKKSEGEGKKLPEQDEIERIRRELQSIKGQEPQERVQASSEAAMKSKRDNLSGEVSISDLRKGSDRF